MLQFLLYCFCGGLGVTTDYLTYYFVLSLGFWYQFANILGYFTGTLVSFFLNRIITFGVHDKLGKRLSVFLGVASIGYFVSAVLLWLIVDKIHVDAKVAKILTLPIVVIIQFSINKRFTFRK